MRLAQLIMAALVTIGAPPAMAQDSAGVEFFERKIRPVLVERCYSCHSAEAERAGKLKGNLWLDSRAGLLAGGDLGPAVEPGDPDASWLVSALRYDDFVQMPPEGKLPDAVIADFAEWVRMGAPDPRTEGPAAGAHDPLGADPGPEHWAYQPPLRPALPEVRDASWPVNAIDHFVLARLEAEQKRPAAEADRATLLRRLSYDLIGLPPSPEEIGAFEADPSPTAYEAQVERLLASPHFGERWGRHWLDVVRFAESFTLRGLIPPGAWRYRDYVIEAFNEDLPFDQFVHEQIAGDLLPAADLGDQRRQLTATALLALGNTNLEEQDKRQLEMDVVDEQIDVIGKAFLGQTISCARCHDHKFDPIPTADYYALAGILNNVTTLEHANVSKWVARPLPLPPEQEEVLAAHEARVAELERQVRAQRARKEDPEAAEALKNLTADLKRLRAEGPQRDVVPSVLERPQAADLPIHIRGSVHTLGEMVPRGVLKVASHGDALVMPDGQSGRRELADWLANARNPLTARVLVNRAWHWLFGAGLVSTPDNFGTTGEPPSHPELLDDLALRFVEEDGWSMKALVRRIVLSRTYRQGLTTDPRVQEADPEGRLLAGRTRRRLDAECLRDAVLSVSGRLDRTMGGPGYPEGLTADYGFQHTGTRRSVYAPAFRNAPLEMLTVFDAADSSMVVGRRDVSTVAPQALFLLNHPFILDESRHAAARLLAVPGLDDRGRIDRACLLTLGRLPTEAERRSLMTFLAGWSHDETGEPLAEDPWALVFQALFASADFRFVE